jgi:hypothetical protein
MRIALLLASSALVCGPRVARAQKDTDCRGLKLSAVSGFPDGAVHIYNFEGTCRVFEIGVSHSFGDPTMVQRTRAEIRWVAATGEVHEWVTTEGKYHGLIEMFLRCPRDPVVNTGACTQISYHNSTGWPGFDGAWHQRRPITRGKTTSFIAQTLQAQMQLTGKTAHDPGPGGVPVDGGSGMNTGQIGPGGPGGTSGSKMLEAAQNTAPRNDGAAKTMKSPSGITPLEAEGMIARAQVTHGKIGAQDMKTFGTGWGGNAQLFWEVSQNGAQLRLEPIVPVAGRFEVFVVFTKGPDFGLFRASFDGKTEILVNGYAPAVSRDRALVGMFDLTPGPHELLLSIAGRESQSSAMYVGIDRIELKQVR